MQLIIQIFSLIAIYILIGVFKYKTEYNFQFDEEVPYIRMHKGYGIAGVACTIIMASFSMWEYFVGSKSLSVVFFIVAVLSSLLFLSYYGFRIAFDKEKIVYRYFFETPKTIFYKDIVEVGVGLDLIIRTKDRKLTIPNYMTNIPALLLKMMPYMPKRKKVKEVPRVRSFSESVERSQEFIIVFAMLEIFFIGFGVWGAIATKFDTTLILVSSLLWGAITGMIFLCVHSAKRAHSSSFWNKIANLLFKEGCLKD